MAGPGPIYGDIRVSETSPDHVQVDYHPRFNEDFSYCPGLELIPFQGAEYWGRALIVAVPPHGEIFISSSQQSAGHMNGVGDGKYLPETMPMVVRGGHFQARGRHFERVFIFPYRQAGGSIEAYTDFSLSIDIQGTDAPTTVEYGASRIDSVLAFTVINPDQFFTYGAERRTVAAKAAVAEFDNADWIKVVTSGSGVTRLSGAALQQAGVNLAALSSDNIKIFYAGGVNPDYDPTSTDQVLAQIAIKVEDGGDGLFGVSDNILFYAEDVNRYEFVDGEPEYLFNAYNKNNVYWLAIGSALDGSPLRWGSVDGQPSGSADKVVTVTNQPVRAEQNNNLKIDSDDRIRDYYDWYWTDREQTTFTVQVNLPQLSVGDSLDIEMGAIANFGSSQTYINVNGTQLTGYYDGGSYYHYFGKSGAIAGLNSLALGIAPSGSRGSYLDFLNIVYPMQLTYGGSQLAFSSYANSGVLRYTIGGLTTSQAVLDITDSDHPDLVSGIQIQSGSGQFQLPADRNDPSQFAVFASSNYRSPVSLSRTDVGGLRSDVSQADCLVVSPRSFQGALQEYVDYREASTGSVIRLVAVEDIYNEFGYGLKSPMAIRNFLKYAYENYTAPAPYAVLFAGDGTYDFLNNMGLNAGTYVPPFIWSYDISAGDDNFVYFGKLDSLDSDHSYNAPLDRGWDMMTSRWPVRSSSEISHYIQKLKSYESPETEGSWRSRITYVADDEFKGSSSSEIIHTAQTEELAMNHTPSAFEKQKIYLTEYPFASNGDKPSVNDAIVEAINNGTLIINYIGHGSPDVWADEHVFRKAGDLGRLHNADKLATVIAASCSIGFFDAPDKEGMAEVMFRMDGGAIAVISATRLVYARDNSIFNYDLYDAIFNGQYSLSEAVFATKMLHQFTRPTDISLLTNDRSYVAFGDPLAQLGLPEYRFAIAPGADSVLTPLDYFSFSGQVVDEDDQPVNADGTVEVAVFDSPIIRHHPLGISYSLGGPTIFRGPVAVANGQFAGGFVVPLDIDYGGTSSRISGYGSFGMVSGIGGKDSLAISETTSTTTENAGPDISISFAEVPDFESGRRIPENATLRVDLSDNSGINLTGGLGHRIELVIDNDNSAMINLTDKFAYETGSYQSGSLEFSLPDMEAGGHTFKIRAWDNANNPSVTSFDALTSAAEAIALEGVMNWPNPMEEQTEFFFDLTESAESVELQIFTLAGRLIYHDRATDLTVGPNRVFYWNGRDTDGDRVAEGVYIYKLTARSHTMSSSSSQMAEVFGKLVLLN